MNSINCIPIIQPNMTSYSHLLTLQNWLLESMETLLQQAPPSRVHVKKKLKCKRRIVSPNPKNHFSKSQGSKNWHILETKNHKCSIFIRIWHTKRVTDIHINKVKIEQCDVSCKLQSNEIVFVKAYCWGVYFPEMLHLKSSDQ